MSKVKLDKYTKERKPFMNNWVKFFLGDLLISVGVWAASYNGAIFALPAAFGIIGGIGTFVALLANLME